MTFSTVVQSIIPLLGVLLGFFLSLSSNLINRRLEDKRKLKGAIFHLLQLRHYFKQQLNSGDDINRIIDLIKTEFLSKLNVNFSGQEEKILFMAKPLLDKIIPKSDFDLIYEKAEKAIIETSEYLPILAFELTANKEFKDSIDATERLNSFLNGKLKDVAIPFEDWFQPKLKHRIIDKLDQMITKASLKVGKRFHAEVERKLTSISEKPESLEKNLVKEYIENIIKSGLDFSELNPSEEK